MEAWLILLSIATIPFNTTSRLSFTVSTSSLPASYPNQNIKFTYFADSQLFGLLYKNMDAMNIQLIFENFKSIKITQSHSLCIKLSPGDPFIKIGNVWIHIDTHECKGQKNGVEFGEMSSQIMGIIGWRYWIW